MTDSLLKLFRTCFAALIMLYFFTPLSLAQGGSGGGNKGGNGGGSTGGNNGPSSPGNNQGSSQPAGNQGPSSPGITSGSMAIESTLFAYKALASDAAAISAAVQDKVSKDEIVVIGTLPDFASLVQWRATMYQVSSLDTRVNGAIASLNAVVIPDFFPGVQKNVPTVGGAFLASPSDVQALVQTLASIFAVNESVSAATGALTSVPLTSRLAELLRHNGVKAYVPSVYSPNLLRYDDLHGTFIGARLDKLEQDRQTAVTVGQRYSQALADAQTVAGSSEPTTDPTITNISPPSGPVGTIVTITGSNFGPPAAGSTVTFRGTVAAIRIWTPSRIMVTVPALPPVVPNGTAIQVMVTAQDGSSSPINFTFAAAAGSAVPHPGGTPADTYTHQQKLAAAAFTAAASLKIQALASLVTAIDTLESTLLTGQTGSGSSQNQNGSQQPTTTANGGPGNPPLTGGGGNNNQTGGNNANTPAPSGPNTSQSPLQQILPADLLAHQIWNSAEPSDVTDMGKIHVLVIQTLESGGSQLTKSNLFLGSRIYFNGGAVATFGLYGIDGEMQCGGFVYAYGGYAKDDNFGGALDQSNVVVGDNTCKHAP